VNSGASGSRRGSDSNARADKHAAKLAPTQKTTGPRRDYVAGHRRRTQRARHSDPARAWRMGCDEGPPGARAAMTMRHPTNMRELSVDAFYRALGRYGFAISGTRIIDVSGRCPNGSWPVVLKSAGKIDRHRTIRKAVEERTAVMARQPRPHARRSRPAIGRPLDEPALTSALRRPGAINPTFRRRSAPSSQTWPPPRCAQGR
jgi:hypothetical protein